MQLFFSSGAEDSRMRCPGGGLAGPGGRTQVGLAVWIICASCLCFTANAQFRIPPETVQQWANTLGGELYSIVTKYSGSSLLQKIEEVDGLELVRKFAEEMERMLGRKMKSVKALNTVFISNFKKDPTLTWQYFGSSTGFFRLYPGIKWTPDENGVITFDCRNRNWYIQAATSPKDIVIVVDISGSMKGLRLTIAKHTITTILDTLGENDFVNIIAYNDYVHYVEPCFKGALVQADLDNREHFKVLVEELHAKGQGKVKKAMKESFRILNEASATGKGSLCNQAIMLITDGAMEDFQQVFEDYNWPEKKVRVFTYLIGREVTFADNVKWIACNNKGYYTHISTLADVQENVMEYLHVLSRPMVINHDHDIIWTEAYMDTVLFNSQAQSLLLMTTVAMPVFSKKNETRSHGILLGVVGSDVPLKELMKLAPRYKYKEGKKLKPKPNYNSVDLSEVEWEDTDEIRRVIFLKNDYFYTTINDTPFSLGMVLTRGHGEYIFMGNVSVEEGLHDLMQPDLTIADEWTYCETDIDPQHRKLTQLMAVIGYLTGEEPELECDEELLQEVLFDAVVTAPMEAYWTALLLNADMEEGVETAFLGTRAGLMRISRYAGTEKRVARKFLTPSDKENLFTMDHFPLWYRRAAEHPPGSFLYYIPNPESRDVFRDYEYDYSASPWPEDLEQEYEDDGKALVATTAVTVTVNNKMAIAAGRTRQGSLSFPRPAWGHKAELFGVVWGGGRRLAEGLRGAVLLGHNFPDLRPFQIPALHLQ
ncbi:hypothetical protein JZ751_024134 [Albula glossodonta]|uniref:VWFA domain-containing protein n=1 Tax=Albula glossodonta TaxID=121402 RepID=A0A8T2NEZ3_9TELE|nr:hypothetical protein JZ751_024134 [Albula glossodonta]